MEVSPVEIVKAKSLDYAVDPASSSVLQKITLTPSSGAGPYTVGAGNQTLVFEIPPSNYNFSKSFLSFTYTVAAGGAGEAHAHYAHIPPLQQLQFQGQGSNIQIVNITDFAGYWAATRGFEKYDTFIKENGNALDATSVGGALIAGCRYHAAISENGALNSSVYSNRRAIQTGALTGIPPTGQIATQYLATGEDVTASAFQMRLDLSQLYGTIFCLDKVIPVRQRTNLTLTMATLNQMFVDLAAAIAATTAATTLSVSLTLCQEVNPLVVQSLNAKVASGMFDLLIPYVSQSNYSTTASSSNVAQFNNTSNGAVNLLGHLISPMLNDNSAAAIALRGSAYDYNGALIASHQATIDNYPIDSQLISHANPAAEDWRLYEKFLRGSAVNLVDFLSLYKVMVYWYGANSELSETDWDLAQGYRVLNSQSSMFQLIHTAGATASRLVCNAIYQISIKATMGGLVYNSSAPVDHIAPTPMPSMSGLLSSSL